MTSLAAGRRTCNQVTVTELHGMLGTVATTLFEPHAMSKHHVQAIDLIKQNKWDQAHEIVQQHSDSLSSLIHAYIHKLEGDLPRAC